MVIIGYFPIAEDAQRFPSGYTRERERERERERHTHTQKRDSRYKRREIVVIREER